MKAKFYQAIFVATIAGVISGCAITQQVRPVQLSNESSNDAFMCVLKNDRVRDSVLDEITRALDIRQYQYRVIDESFDKRQCEWVLTYVAKWRWDLSMYMSLAKFKIFQNGVLQGEAVYDATKGAGGWLNLLLRAKRFKNSLMNCCNNQRQSGGNYKTKAVNDRLFYAPRPHFHGNDRQNGLTTPFSGFNPQHQRLVLQEFKVNFGRKSSN